MGEASLNFPPILMVFTILTWHFIVFIARIVNTNSRFHTFI